MKALSIAAEHRTVAVTEIGGREDITKLIGFDTIESEAVGTDGDRIYFDEECFLRGAGGRFQVDSLIPISGNAVIVGTSRDGSVLRDAATDIDSLRRRIKWL
jgi:hypothetical protein